MSVSSVADKIKEISAKFDLAEDIVSDEVNDVIEAEVSNIVRNKKNC
jgi:hypothetical protein